MQLPVRVDGVLPNAMVRRLIEHGDPRVLGSESAKSPGYTLIRIQPINNGQRPTL